MPLIKVIWYLIGCGEERRSGGLCLKKMTIQGQQRYEATACAATADNPPSSTAD